DPRSGRQILDRDLERRLAVAGRDPLGKRHADLVMRAYPWLARRLELDAAARVAFLNKCLKVSPYEEEAWLEFARLVKAGELQADQKQVVLGQLASLQKTFANYPDFVRRMLDDLVAAQPDAGERVKLYEQAAALFERARRPDLACDARLKATELLCEQGRWQAAAQGLTLAIRKF